MSDLRKIKVDGIEVEVDGALTLLQACEVAGKEIPRFCYHERLSIAGNCRMCLVEVKGGPPKPAASCAMQVRDMRPGPEGQPPEIFTNTPMVKKAREGVMEFLLINHPLDCPICDQGGECDLQDQAMAYGVDFSRFREAKRAVDDINLGPLVGTQMTRCISCTRCVRFTTEVCGVTQMGQTGRGEDAEIASYLNANLDSEMQGNVVDLCPVGALTNKPYAFNARPWELKKTESIDVMDALGSNIRVDVRGRAVMRVLPRNHDDVNEEWIADKARHICDGLARQRLDKPYIRRDGKLTPASWGEALGLAAEKMKGATKVAALAGDLAPVEAIWSLKQMVEGLGGATECRTDGAKLPIGNRSGVIGSATIADIDAAERILLIGTNPRIEAPVLNARIRKAWMNGAVVANVGAPADLTYDVIQYGAGRDTVKELLGMDHSDKQGGNGVIILGQGAISGDDGEAVLAAAMKLADAAGAKLLILHTAASRVGAMEVGFATKGGMAAATDDADVIYNLGADEIDIPAGAFVIYQGSHGDRGAHRADVILPGAAYTEQSGIFLNTEGRAQMANRAGFPPGDAKEDWAILRALSAELGATQGWNTLDGLRAAMFEAHPSLARIDQIEAADWTPLPLGDIGKGGFESPIKDHYLTNPIARASAIMAEMSRLAAERKNAKLAAE
ncbi:MAG: NADH-quinone oxidoreductase subunit NuoG [Pseudomonadota bacterium]